LPTSPPVGTPPVSGSGPDGGLAGQLSGPNANQNLYPNHTPSSNPGANPVLDQVPGTTGPVSQQRVDDLTNWTIGALNNRNTVELGGVNVGGNNINADGSWNVPDFLRNSSLQNGGLMAQYNSSANTDATTRQVQSDETVEGRLARLSRSDNELNRIAVEDANEQSAASGMIGGSTAASGAALRASRAAMLPVAQQDAAWYGQTAANNMDAVNRDALSDQDLRTGLIGQEAQLAGQESQTAAQLYDNASDRRWKSKEANHERIWNTMENQLADLRRGTDREDQQNFAVGDREDQQDWNSWQSGLQREFTSSQAQLDRTFQGDQAALNRAQERQTQFFSAMFGREGTMASILASIYSNPDMTPEQQQAAARNARTIMSDLWSSFNATLAQGIPDIFGNPYPQQPGGQQPPPAGQQPPPTTPPNGQPPGSYPSPVIGTNPDGSPIYATHVGNNADGTPIWEDGNGNPINP
jgi:hypothetical protein